MHLAVSSMRERSGDVNFTKALAIISVILLHSLALENLLEIGAPLHIWQAVPLFFLVGGMNRAKSVHIHGRNFSISKEYSQKKCLR